MPWESVTSSNMADISRVFTIFIFLYNLSFFSQNINGFILSSYSGNDGLIFQTASDNLNETDLYQSFKLLMKKNCDVLS